MTLLILHGVAVLVASIGAYTDTRMGKLPNWLTLPPILITPPVVWGTLGSTYGLRSLMGIAICGFIPFVLFKAKGIAGGDVKMLAAIGAIMGPSVGLGAEFYGFFAAAIFALGRLAWQGKLFVTLTNTFLLAFNWALPTKYKRTPTEEELTTMRMGVPILVGVLAAAITETPIVYRALLL